MKPAETTEGVEPYRKTRSYRWLGFILLVPILYVLSFGPAAAVYFKYGGQLPGTVITAIEWVYKPLEYLRFRCPFIAKPLEYYVDLWLKLL